MPAYLRDIVQRVYKHPLIHVAHEATATIALTRVEDTSSYGVCVREGTRITQVDLDAEAATKLGEALAAAARDI